MDAPTLDPGTLLQDLVWVRRLAARLVRDPAAADDLAQETWVRALERGPRGARLTRAWLGTVLRNLVHERGRRAQRRRAREERVARPERVRSTDDLAGELELQGRLARLVLALDEPYRSTVLLRFVHDLEPARIARRLGVPPATVRSRLKRALDTLRARLDGDHGGDRSAWLRAAAPWIPAAGGASEGAPAAFLVLTGALMKSWSWGVAALLAIALGVVWRTAGAPAESRGSGATSSAGPASDPGSAPGPGELAPADERVVADSAAPVPAAPATTLPPAVRGRVVDLEGDPVPGVEVFVGAEQDPFPADSELPRMGWDHWQGRTVATRADGTFEAVLARPGPVRVVANLSAPWVASYKDERARRELPAVAPAEGLELVLVGNAWARLSVTVVDAATGRSVETFRLSLEGGSVGLRIGTEEDGRLDLEVPLLSGGPETLELVVHQPRSEPPPRRELVLRPGDEREVVIALQSEHLLRGRVLDRAGRPVAGASVFFGTLREARGDEPFEPYAPGDAFGTRTDAEGRFELAGNGELVSAWHPEHASATVPVVEAWSIVLGQRGTVIGRGAPGKSLTWDEETQVEVTEGAFRIANVDPGAHRVTLAGGADFGVRIAAGETVELDLSGRLERVELLLGEEGRGARGFLIGLGQAFSVLEFRFDGDAAELREVLPGRYHAFLFDGRQGAVTIDGTTAELDLGSGELALLAPPGSRVVLAPAGADDLVATVAARLPARVGESGRLSFARWPTGRWTARLQPSGEPAEVLVGDEPVALDLRD